jgi:hypothetical protein
VNEPWDETGSAREEAERLVAAALAAASVAARGLVRNVNPLSGVADAAERLLAGGSGGHVATGSPECCVCPMCRAIAAVRDPSPQLAVKLATGAAGLAGGVTEVLRAVGGLVAGSPATRRGESRGEDSRRTGPAAPRRAAADPDLAWRMATTAPAATAPASTAPAATAPASTAPAATAPAGTPPAAAPRSAAAAAAAVTDPDVLDDPWRAATTAPVPAAPVPDHAPSVPVEPVPPADR